MGEMGKRNAAKGGARQEDISALAELIDGIQQLLIENAIKSAPLYSLAELLRKKAVAELRNMANLTMVSGTRTMKKADLVDTLVAELPKKSQVEAKLSMLSLSQWQLFCKVFDSEIFVSNDIFIDDYLPSQSFGLLQAFYHDGNMMFLVADEIKKTCLVLMESGGLADIEKTITLKEYAKAAVNLYGIIPLDELVNIYNSQNADKTDEDELFQKLLAFIGEENNEFYFFEEYLVYPEFEDEDFETVADLASEIEGKPRYIPEKESFLRYADEYYWDETEQSKRMEQYLRTGLGQDIVRARRMVSELALSSVGEIPFREQVDMLVEAIGPFKNDAQAEKFFKLLTDMRNNSRIWSNKGHTPLELTRRMGGPVLGVMAGGKRKIGRNEPCPCGSGKKYKHCCGRSS